MWRPDEARRQRLSKDDARGLSRAALVALVDDLSHSIRGEVRFSDGDRALYATDGSNYRQAPVGVVIPRDADDVERTVAIARRHGAPILPRGGGTSLAGQTCNVAVVLDFSKYVRSVRHVDAERRTATVEPGCVLDHLRSVAKERAGLTFGPDPATHSRCTLGGMLGNNSCGSHSLMSKNAGLGLRTSDNTLELEVLTYRGERLRVGRTSEEERARICAEPGTRGEIYRRLQALVERHADAIRARYPRLERRVSGYNLPDLLPENGFDVARALVGSEGTCVTILEATLHLVPEPGARTLVVLGYPDVYTAADHLEEILSFRPTALEGIDHLLFEYVKKKGDENADLALLPPGGGFLLVEFGGASREESDGTARRMMDALARAAGDRAPTMKLYDDPVQEKMIWKVREGSLGSTAWVPGQPDAWEGWEDSAVPVEHVGKYLRALRSLFDRYDYHPSLYGHLGQGCVHCRVPFDLYTTGGIEKWRAFMEDATNLVASLGGSHSGEHGDGQSRAEFLPKLLGPEVISAMQEFKRIWDPDEKMNPGKVVNLHGEPYGLTEHLRLGPDYAPPHVETHFSYPGDRHSFGRATLRCVGVGECRREDSGTMCPSYMVTHEEKHSTRGRARMLFEMLNGELVDGGWTDESVKDALDLCLSCKGCKSDCPVNVDMATYRAEFLAHYFEKRSRPRQAHAFGRIRRWAELAQHVPTFVNAAAHLPVSSRLAKSIAGMDPRREIPRFSPQTFRAWFRRHAPRNPNGPVVLLFPDTFNDFFHPAVARAAVAVLEDAGFRVECPQESACCGRPLYDYGFLDAARKQLLRTLDVLRPAVRAGVPIVVLEPSCWAVFRDELTNLLADDMDAHRLADLSFTFGGFLAEQAPNYDVPRLARRALLHGHCHQKSLESLDDRQYGSLRGEKTILAKMGVEVDAPELGCCGMAGGFGFEKGRRYEVSVAAGERAILPKVRACGGDTLIIADGFSCREQIRQGSERHGLHLAEVVELGLREDSRPSRVSGETKGRVS
ncbi:MAG TPA: FAD-binding and (Fe-S)-binding domain-containing protein [Polyangiaceae bacterium]|nr:FAD-binding and (Fe-S)-binding domain-containing protein [Polyangiaceae bacterium]